MDAFTQYPYLNGTQWHESMESWAKGGKGVSLHAFPWNDWLELSLTERMHLFLQREWFIRQFGYILPNLEFIQACLPHGPFLEIGAGSGFLASLLSKEGADIIATDLGTQDYSFEPGRCFPIFKYHAEKAIEHFSNRTVILAWPCYQDSWAADALKQIQRGQKLIYIGEEQHGCNATSQFFEILKNEFSILEKLPWKPFPYIQDRATVYIKNQ